MMMRTIEVLLSVTILFAAFMVISYFAVLPSPRLVSSPNLSELASSTLNTLDSNGELSKTAFASLSDPSWTNLQNALTASLPPNIVYNFSVYNIVTSASGVTTYGLVNSFTDSQGSLGATSYSSSYIVTSSNVTFTATPQKIGQSYGKNITLYILNCNDANGWWITGYTAQSLASDLRNLLSPYFQTTILVNSTYQLGCLLNGTRISTLPTENIANAVVINTFGEAVPIPAGYYNKTGYDSKDGSYANYTHTLGLRVNTYNWTWVSIVGYPFYYVTNTKTFSNTQNTWGIYGMRIMGINSLNPNGEGSSGLNAFLQGLAGQKYVYNDTWITGSPGVVHFTQNASYYSNYYGVYPSPYQTSTRALPTYILGTYHLNVLPSSYIFNVYQGWIAGATYNHIGSDGKIHGSLTAIGLTRIPDIRITALGLLQFYRPTIYKSQYGASGTSRLVVLQLAQQGGV
jgi:hypothetical protein